MTAYDRLSTQITNRDATPVVFNNGGLTAGVDKSAIATLEAVSGDGIGSTYRLVTVPSNAYIRQVLLSCDDIGTTTVADVGVYKTTKDGSAVVDADFFGSAVSLKDGALTRSDITNESGVYPIENMVKPLWEALGLSSDPCIDYDIVLTLTAAADAAGTITLEVRYAV